MKNNLKILLLFLSFGLSVQSFAQTQLDSITFAKDYFPGTTDSNGKHLGSTETMSIVQHNGKLFAGMGNWMDYPITTQSDGTQVLRKDSYNSPWVVDTTIGFTSLRCDGFQNITFTKDNDGNLLPSPKELLVGGFTRTIPPYKTSIWVRKDSINTWYRNIVGTYSSVPGLTGVRSFCVHTDNVTGKQWLFCGTASGAIVKAAYDPSQLGLLQIDTIAEIDSLGRVIAMTNCEGKLYASAGIKIIGNDTVGGIYKRIDGTNPSWELVYRWPYDSTINDDQHVLRGLTTIPDPLGSTHDVIIGAKNKGGVIQILQPFNNDSIYTELDVTQYFADLWFSGFWPYMDYALIAYNNFTPDTIDGQKVWWVSLAIYAPNQTTQPNNGAYYLLRYENGTYKWGYIYDNNNIVPNGESLRATRTICKSPFAEDDLKGYYFGGYDCLNDTSHNTAWIYKGFLNDLTSEVKQQKLQKVKIFPNPSSDYIKIEGLNQGTSIKIMNGIGEIIFKKKNGYNSIIRINTEAFKNGIYLIQIRNNGNVINKKLVILR